MPAWLYDQGHIGWALFAALVYSGVLVLVVDYLWRRVTMSSRVLAAGSLLLWIIGVVLIGLGLQG